MYPNKVATSGSIFYRIICVGIGVFCLLGLTKVMFLSNISDTTTPSLPPTPQENTEIMTLYDIILFCTISFENMLLLLST